MLCVLIGRKVAWGSRAFPSLIRLFFANESRGLSLQEVHYGVKRLDGCIMRKMEGGALKR